MKKLVKVTWRDAWFEFERGGGASDRDDYLVVTYGIIDTDERGRFLSVVSEELPDEDGERAVTHVPRVGVVEVDDLSVIVPTQHIPEWFVQEY